MIRRNSEALSPYVAGAGVGALCWVAFATAKKPLGVTTAFESTAAGIAQNLAPQAMRVNKYLATRDEAPAIDWEWMLAAGITVGSYLAARATKTKAGPAVPALWARRFGKNPLLRQLGAFAGGALMMFGARMAKGCTSGHGISGNLQLAKSSWLFSAVFGSTAVATTRILFGGAR